MNTISKTATGVVITISFLLVACSSSYKLTNISAREAKSFVSDWPAKPQEVANTMIDKYGPQLR